MAWSNQVQNSLTVGPDNSARRIVIADNGPVTNGTEIDLYSGAPGETQPAVLAASVNTGIPGGVSQIGLAAPRNSSDYVSSVLATVQLNESDAYLVAECNAGAATVTATCSSESPRITLDAPQSFVTGQIEITGPINDTSGHTYYPIARGKFTATTNASGQLIIPHGLFGIPTSVSAIANPGLTTTQAFLVQVAALDATNLTVTVFLMQVAGAISLYNGHVFTVYWTASL